MNGFDIGRGHVGDDARCLIVAEVAQAHDGSLGMAHAYIDAVAEAGADAVKFQYHLGDTNDRWRVVPKWGQDFSRSDYWKRTAFSPVQLAGLAKHARDLDLIFLCSPFSVEAVEVLDPLVPAWKIPSGHTTDIDLLRAVKRGGKSVILSTGMSTMAEIYDTMDLLETRVALLQCTSSYPTAPDEVGLGLLAVLREKYRCPVGLSDHTGTIGPSLGAIALGASIVEVHVCFPGAYSLDAESSLTPKQLKRLVKHAWEIEQAMKPVDKDQMSRELEPMRSTFMPRVGEVAFRDDLLHDVPKRAHSHVSRKVGCPACEVEDSV